MGKRSQRTPTGIIDRLLEQSAVNLLGFILSTALIGGSGYLLLQLPNEMNAIRRAQLEFERVSEEFTQSPFWNNIAGFPRSELTAGRVDRMHEISRELGRTAAKEGQLDQTFASVSLSWISSTRVEYEREKGRVKGFVLVDAIEKAFQQDVVEECDARIAMLNEMYEMIGNWAAERLADRDKRFSTLERLARESRGRFAGMISKGDQLNMPLKIFPKQAAQMVAELETQIQAIQIKIFLAAAGIIVGAGAFGFLGLVALKKKS